MQNSTIFVRTTASGCDAAKNEPSRADRVRHRPVGNVDRTSRPDAEHLPQARPRDGVVGGKLGRGSRAAAVAEAARLGLL